LEEFFFPGACVLGIEKRTLYRGKKRAKLEPKKRVPVRTGAKKRGGEKREDATSGVPNNVRRGPAAVAEFPLPPGAFFLSVRAFFYDTCTF